MNFILTVNRAADSERGIECLSVRACEDDYLMYLRALVEDISNLSNVSNVQLKKGDDFDCIVIESSLSRHGLLDTMEMLFSRDFCYLRYIDLAEK